MRLFNFLNNSSVCLCGVLILIIIKFVLNYYELLSELLHKNQQILGKLLPEIVLIINWQHCVFKSGLKGFHGNLGYLNKSEYNTRFSKFIYSEKLMIFY